MGVGGQRRFQKSHHACLSLSVPVCMNTQSSSLSLKTAEKWVQIKCRVKAWVRGKASTAAGKEIEVVEQKGKEGTCVWGRRNCGRVCGGRVVGKGVGVKGRVGEEGCWEVGYACFYKRQNYTCFCFYGCQKCLNFGIMPVCLLLLLHKLSHAKCQKVQSKVCGGVRDVKW